MPNKGDAERYALRQARHKEAQAWAAFSASLSTTDYATIRRLMYVYLGRADKRAALEERLGNDATDTR